MLNLHGRGSGKMLLFMMQADLIFMFMIPTKISLHHRGLQYSIIKIYQIQFYGKGYFNFWNNLFYIEQFLND